MGNAILSAPAYQKWIIIFSIVVAFGLSLKNGYSLDDHNVTTEMHAAVARGIAGIPDILSSPYGINAEDEDVYEYRPVTPVTFAIERSLFSFNPAVSHLVNLLLYIGLVWVVWKTSRLLLASYPAWVPFLVALVFAVHPLHSEVVNSLKNREELIVSLCGFGTLLFCLHYLEKKKRRYLVFIFLLLAIGTNTKTSLTAFVIGIPAALAYFNRLSWKKGALLVLVFVGVTGFSFLLPRFFIEEELYRKALYFENPLFYMKTAERLPMAFYCFLAYIRLHVFPYPLLSYYGYAHVPVAGWTNIQVYMGMGAMAVMLWAVVYFYRRNRLIGAGLFLWLIFLLPFLNFPFPVTGIIAERFTFNAVWGYAIFLTGVLHYLLLQAKLVSGKFAAGILVAALVAGMIINVNRTQDWESTYSLLAADAPKAPRSVKLQIMYGDIIQAGLSDISDPSERKERIGTAVRAYERAIRYYPVYAGTYSNLGVLYSVQGNYPMAIKNLEEAIRLGEQRAENLFNLGACYEITGNISRAKAYYTSALERKPGYTPACERLQLLNNADR